MMRKKELIIILLIGLFCFSTVRGSDGDRIQRRVPAPEAREQQVDPYENTSVLVEAFVVEIPTNILSEAGVSPIGQAPEGVTILKILWCLKDTDDAEVVSGSKLMVRHNSRSEMSNRDTFYIKREKVNIRKTPDGPVETKDVRFDSYDSGIQFEAHPTISQDGVRVSYKYSASGFEENDDQQSPPDRYSFDWEGTVTAASGLPVIAGGLQSENAVTFLILTATVQNLQDND